MRVLEACWQAGGQNNVERERVITRLDKHVVVALFNEQKDAQVEIVFLLAISDSLLLFASSLSLCPKST